MLENVMLNGMHSMLEFQSTNQCIDGLVTNFVLLVVTLIMAAKLAQLNLSGRFMTD